MIALFISIPWQPVFAPQLQEPGRISTLGWFLIALAIIFVLALLLMRATRGSSVDAPTAPHHAEPEPAVRAAPVEVFPSVPEDLTKIEGIGPKINQVLQDNGIHTFAQLAATGVADLEAILSRANLRLANPATWPEQARLAAEGRWDEFAQLTSRLRGGRQV